MLAVQARNQFKNHLAGTAIEIAGRLISQQQLGLRDEGPCQRQPLLLAAGKLSRTMMSTLGQSHLVEPPRSLFFS